MSDKNIVRDASFNSNKNIKHKTLHYSRHLHWGQKCLVQRDATKTDIGTEHGPVDF